jgi:hypothetical protein
MGTIEPSVLSTAVIRDLLRDGIRTGIDDPASAKRPTASQFVTTSYPDRSVYYPLIVVGEVSDRSYRPDIRAEVWKHTYAAQIMIHAKSMTQLYQLRDGVRAWIENNIRTLEQAGYMDASVSSSSSATWDAAATVYRWRLVVTGTVWTAPESEEEEEESE